MSHPDNGIRNVSVSNRIRLSILIVKKNNNLKI